MEESDEGGRERDSHVLKALRSRRGRGRNRFERREDLERFLPSSKSAPELEEIHSTRPDTSFFPPELIEGRSGMTRELKFRQRHDHGEARVAPLGSMRIEGLLQKEKQGVSLLSLGPL